ncbi:MAG: Na+/H+ antiporter NhaA [Myxococcota bacterium]
MVNLLQEFSIPLLSGVAVALVAANFAGDWYQHTIHWHPFGDFSVFGHVLDLHFIVNDVFMVFFFGIAAKEITEACLPGGSLNPPRKAMNPLIATLGGVIGPVVVFFLGLTLCFQLGLYDAASDDWALLSRGWGIPTATDIALAWLVARTVFGRGHPAIDFLLLLAIADDAIGLVIIAVFYGDPSVPAQPLWLGLCGAGMAAAWGLRRAGVRSWLPYVFVCGPMAWSGLVLAHLHAALALVFIVPFMPGPQTDTGMFAAEDELDVSHAGAASGFHHSPLHRFEHDMKAVVDFGLFFFAFANAGVELAGIDTMTWLILSGLVVGKTVGITAFGLLAGRLGFPLPARTGLRELVMAGFIAALGLTVALFVATAAFSRGDLQGQAKMGALLSGFVGIAAIALGRILGIGQAADAGAEAASGGDAAPERTAGP